jgi:tRNA pseudouridine38-40 synthase
MKEAAELIAGRHDFQSFTEKEDEPKKHSKFEKDKKKSSTVVVVEKAEIFTDGDLICFRIGASHFTWKMVRRLVGSMAEIGRGKRSIEDFHRQIKFYTNAPAATTAPPSGLFLEKVLYKGDTPPQEQKAIFPV